MVLLHMFTIEDRGVMLETSSNGPFKFLVSRLGSPFKGPEVASSPPILFIKPLWGLSH
jgi:hypothetical protein